MHRSWARLVLVMLAASVFYFAQELETLQSENPNSMVAAEMVLFGAVGFSLFLLACRRRAATWLNRYVLFVGLMVFGMGTSTLMLANPYRPDTSAAVQYGAELLLKGQNPYASFDMLAALQRFALPDSLATRLVDGSVEEHLNYPAGSFLLIAPFIAAGVRDTRLVYMLALAAMAVAIHYYADQRYKNLVVLALLSNVVALRITIVGLPEPLWALPLLLAWTWRDKRWPSSVALGVAASIKQLAWFFAPYYVVMTIKEYGWKESVRRSAIGVGVFLAVNLPFIVLSPIDWLQSILAPIADPLVPLGAGVVALAIYGVMPSLPSQAYSILEATVFGAGLVWYYRNYVDSKEAAMILATLPLWFAWRSLDSYFYLSGLLFVGVMMAEKAREQAVEELAWRMSPYRILEPKRQAQTIPTS